MADQEEATVVVCNVNISDIFFNQHLGDTEKFNSKHEFIGYDEEKLIEAASELLKRLESLGVAPAFLCEPSELVADFLARN